MIETNFRPSGTGCRRRVFQLSSNRDAPLLYSGPLLGLVLWTVTALAKPRAWFANGYHGGVYGHYPPSFTQFMLDALRQHPDWKLNLEIEPETWDFARTYTPEAYQVFRTLIATQLPPKRIEFVNPAYGQSHLWNISGESVIQQLERACVKSTNTFPMRKSQPIAAKNRVSRARCRVFSNHSDSITPS